MYYILLIFEIHMRILLLRVYELLSLKFVIFIVLLIHDSDNFYLL
jgi:hypothetical protein